MTRDPHPRDIDIQWRVTSPTALLVLAVGVTLAAIACLIGPVVLIALAVTR